MGYVSAGTPEIQIPSLKLSLLLYKRASFTSDNLTYITLPEELVNSTMHSKYKLYAFCQTFGNKLFLLPIQDDGR